MKWKKIPKTFIDQLISNVDVVREKHENHGYQCDNCTEVDQSQWMEYGVDFKLIMKLQVEIGHI